jgi:hypothetical protein
MKAPENIIEKFLKKFYMSEQASLKSSSEKNRQVVEDALSAYRRTLNKRSVVVKQNLWRIIMNSKITKLATVAVVILAVVVGVTLIDRSATPAYAIEQTIEAMRSISSVRAYSNDLEVLFQINPETGQEEYYRVEEGNVLTVATPEKTYHYDKDKNVVRISDEYVIGVEVRFSRFIEDMADWAQEHNRKMDHRLEFDQDLQKEVIKVNVHPAQGNSGGQDSTIDTINVDPKTKLPISFGSIRLEYNAPIPPGSFDFEIPEGAEVVYE